MKSLQDIKIVIGRIDQAFANSIRPADNRLVCNDLGEEGLEFEEFREIKAVLLGKHWRDIIPIVTKAPLYRSLGFLTPEAFCFYLPSFLVGLLRSQDGSTLIFALLRQLTPAASQSFFSIVRHLTAEQEDVVSLFLEQLKIIEDDDFMTEEINRPLAEYWGLTKAERDVLKSC